MTQQPFPGFERVNDKAWGRIGLGEWDQMKWFVDLANTTDFEAMTEGEQLLKKEEFAAMLSVACRPLIEIPPDTKRYPGSVGSKTPQPALEYVPAFSVLDMQRFQNEISPHLDRLADDESTSFGGFNVSFTVNFPKNPHYTEHAEGPRYHVSRGEVGGSPHENLVLRMARLLETYADNVRRCPHCKKVFLQFRRSATYCGPECYTVAGMRRLRAEREAQRALKMKSKKQGRRTTRKGGSRHGKAKR